MAQGIYGEAVRCRRCNGTNVCPKCNGSGNIISESEPYKGQKVPCPLCFGGGDCKLCRGKKKKFIPCLPSKEVIK